MKRTFSYLKKVLKKICLIDKCLLIIMIILFLQLTFNLFIEEGTSTDIDAIDVVVRTTIASIFGYFISSNFIKNKKKSSYRINNTDTVNTINSENISPNNENNRTRNKIECITSEDSTNSRSEGNITSDIDLNIPSKLQIIIVTGIGVVALILILAARNFTEISLSSVPIISQLRDIVCGCVGFLLGCPPKT